MTESVADTTPSLEATLGRYEAEQGELPPICLACGAPAVAFQERSFNWCPPALVVLSLGIFAMIGTRHMRLRMPLCGAHRNYWRQRRRRRILVAVTLFFGVGLALVVRAAWDLQWGSLILLILAVCLLWLFSRRLVWLNTITAKEISDESITLTEVAPAFVLELQRERDAKARRLLGLRAAVPEPAFRGKAPIG